MPHHSEVRSNSSDAHAALMASSMAARDLMSDAFALTRRSTSLQHFSMGPLMSGEPELEERGPRGHLLHRLSSLVAMRSM